MPTVEQVAFAGPLGTLRGLLHRPDSATPAPVAMLLHGYTGQHIEQDRLYVQMARALAAAGFAALRFDFYGSGDSDGDFQEFTVETEVADAAAALDWIVQQTGLDPARVGVVGLSLGGAITALLAGQDARVKAAVLWNAVASTRQMARNLDNDLAPGPDGNRISGGLTVGAGLIESLRQADPLAAIERYAGPTLVIHATDDAVVPTAAAEAYAAALGDRGALRWFEGGSHTFTRPDWRQTVFAWTIDWLAERL